MANGRLTFTGSAADRARLSEVARMWVSMIESSEVITVAPVTLMTSPTAQEGAYGSGQFTVTGARTGRQFRLAPHFAGEFGNQLGHTVNSDGPGVAYATGVGGQRNRRGVWSALGTLPTFSGSWRILREYGNAPQAHASGTLAHEFALHVTGLMAGDTRIGHPDSWSPYTSDLATRLGALGTRPESAARRADAIQLVREYELYPARWRRAVDIEFQAVINAGGASSPNRIMVQHRLQSSMALRAWRMTGISDGE
jgi:hypothetical protein